MTATISNGIVILLLLLQNTFAQYANNAQPKATCNTAGVNYNSVQPGQQLNWQQPPNMQIAPPSQPTQNSQQPGMGSQVKQQNQNTLSDIISVLQGMRFSSQKPQVSNPTTSSCSKQSFEQAPAQLQSLPSSASNNAQSPQYANQVLESPKPSFTFQFVPVSPQNLDSPPEKQVQNSVPIQFMTNGQSIVASPAGPSYYIQNQPTNGMLSQQVPTTQNFQTGSGPSQPVLFAVNSQQPGQSQPVVYTLKSTQPTSSSGTQQNVALPNFASDNPMALLMSQLQSPSANFDLASFLPLLMNSKQEKSDSMKSLLTLILSLLSDRGCGCPNCGCPYNPEPTINGGYSNQINYSKQGLNYIARIPDPAEKNIEESNKREFIRAPKTYKTNVISEEATDEDDEYEYEDDYD